MKCAHAICKHIGSLPARCAGELQQQALTRLALQTLGSFDFGPARLLEFCRDHVVSYLDESDVATRRAAALAAAQVCPEPTTLLVSPSVATRRAAALAAAQVPPLCMVYDPCRACAMLSQQSQQATCVAPCLC